MTRTAGEDERHSGERTDIFGASARLESGVTVGFIGLGRMGQPMAKRLADSGYIVRGFDLSHHAVATASSQITTTDTALEVAVGAAAVILMLPTSVAVERILHSGLLDVVEPGGIVIDMGSSEPNVTRTNAAKAAQRGVTFVDAPVSGGVSGAEAGSLTILFGGSSASVKHCEPLLKSMGDRVVHVGEAGAGHAVKALNNLLSATTLLAVSEAVTIGRRFGVDPAILVEAINGSSGRSGSTDHKFPAFVLTETYASGFSLDLMVKDVGIALSLGKSLGLTTPLSEETLRNWRDAARALTAGADHTEIARWVEQGQLAQ